MAEYAAMLAEQQVPRDIAALLTYLFTEVLDGRNAYCPTACSGPSAARRAASVTTRGAPRAPASGPPWRRPASSS